MMTVAGMPGTGRAARIEAFARIVFWAMLVVSYVVTVAYMWEALTTIPSAERLEESRLVGIPTPRTFFAAAVFSAMELGVVLAALWPWRPAYYGTRLGLTALALITWFLMTIPTGVNRMDWVHRRWLAFLAVAVLAAVVVRLLYRLARRLIT